MRYLIKSAWRETVREKRNRMIKNGWRAITEIKFIGDDPPYYVCVMERDDYQPRGGNKDFKNESRDRERNS